MPWTYSQSTGQFSRNGVVATGYSGAPTARNNPDMQGVHNVGPIPQGRYTIGVPHNTATHGPHVMSLTPNAGTNTFGRAGFLIHGDSVRAPGTASQGCIIMDAATRQKISASGDVDLIVTR
jgi:hypothetical protein